MVIPRRVAEFGILPLLTATLLAVASASPPEEVSPSDRELRHTLETATAAIRREDWKQAVTALDTILRAETVGPVFNRPSIGQLKTGSTVIVSPQRQAERLLAALPAEGRQVYEQIYGPKGAEMLKAAREKNNKEQLQRVVDRYLYTNAGVDALQDLAVWHLDAGRYLFAALSYERLLRHRGVARWTPTQLFHAAIAFRTAGDTDNAAIVSRELLDRASTGAVSIGKGHLTREDIQKELDKLPLSRTLAEWPLFGGNAARNGHGIGGPPFLEPKWDQPLCRTTESQKWIIQAETALTARGQPSLPAATPITAFVERDGKRFPMAVYRSHWGIHAIDINAGKLRWEAPSAWSMDRMIRDTKKVGAVFQWATIHLSTWPGMLVDNSTVGTLSTDGDFVFAVEDFALPPSPLPSPRPRPASPPQPTPLAPPLPPPPPDASPNFRFRRVNDSKLPPSPQPGRFAKVVTDLDAQMVASRLQAYELATGKLKWEIGGVGKTDEKIDVLADSYFLGPPLPLDGKLYVVCEKNHPPASDSLLLACPNLAALDEMRDTREVRLAVLEPHTGKLLSMTPLFTHRRSMLEGSRRIQAVHLAYGYGVLVCCAHTGTVVGVDVLTNRLLWSYTYRARHEEERSERKKPGWVLSEDGLYFDPAQYNRWKVTAPVIADGKVIFTAADAPALTCLDVRTGERLWSVARTDDDLYLAGVLHDKALLIGKTAARAVTLSKGEQSWQTVTGLPAGVGAFAEGRYYLPLKSAEASKRPEICVLDIDRGAMVAHVRSRTKIVPGNLVFFAGDMLSQTAMEFMGFPQLETQLKKIDAALQKTPNDPEGLYWRGYVKLDKGDLAGAVEDLHRSLKNNPPKDLLPLVREKLYEVLMEFLRADFNRAEVYLKECEELCKTEVASAATAEEEYRLQAEQRRRQTAFWMLAGTGREKQGKLSEALSFYLNLALTETGELVPLVTDPALKVSMDIWASGRIEEMLKKATPEQRQQLEVEILEHWKKSKEIKNREKNP